MRIVCLSAESADICYRLGAWDEVVAVSAFAPQEGRERRPVIGGFSTADVERVAACDPDLVITFSDVQAEITAGLIRAGRTVLATNQRTLAQIADTIRMIGSVIGKACEGERLSAEFRQQLESLRENSPRRPRIYFEEWPEPLISGIGWVGELVELTGGLDVFAARRGGAARERTVEAAAVIAADPEIIIASWCGKPVKPDEIASRPGFERISAVRSGQVHAIESDLVLQPGPRLLEGARQLREIIRTWRAATLAR